MQFPGRKIRIKGDLADPEVRRKYAVYAEAAGVLFQLAMFAGKLGAGLMTHCLAIRLEGFRNLSYAVEGIFRIFDLRVTLKKKVTERSGIRRAKYIVAFIAAFFIFEVGFSYFSRAFSRIRNPVAITPGFGVIIFLILCILCRLYLSSSALWFGRKLKSRSMLNFSQKALSDNLVTGLSLLTAVMWRVFGVNIDVFSTIVISISVMACGILIGIHAIRPSVAEEPDPELIRAVRARVRSYDEVIGTGMVSVHFFGEGRRLISMHVKVAENADKAQTYKRMKEIEEAVSQEYAVTLVLHADSLGEETEEVTVIRHRLEEVIEENDERVSFDSLHVVRGRDFSNLIFDLYVPYDYDEERTDRLMEEIRAAMREIRARYSCVISVKKLK